MGHKHKVLRSRRLRLLRVPAAKIDKLRLTNTTRILLPGGSVFLVCRFVGRIFQLNLSPGQFVKVTCAGSPKVVTIGCSSLRFQLPTVHLGTGDSIFITCS